MIVSRKSERKLVKWNINTWDAYYLSYTYLPKIYCYGYFPKPKFTLPPKAKNPLSTLSKYG